MIVSFGDKATEALFHGRPSKQARRLPQDVARVAVRKLDMLNAARTLGDLRSPPGNYLEVLHGDLTGFHSIRVNDQWRLVFQWTGSDAYEVRLVDYH
ncbi:MAG: type II toxin-antitoxin system RelE/ParE family toxin [Acidobacteriia bacterium]|nr:type II toxin-antitoxin system RelE/ParE family toxin [Terriglobia bacterium]